MRHQRAELAHFAGSVVFAAEDLEERLEQLRCGLGATVVVALLAQRLRSDRRMAAAPAALPGAVAGSGPESAERSSANRRQPATEENVCYILCC